VTIDEKIGALAETLVRAGVAPPRAPDDLGPMTELEAAIAPLRLPAAVRRFWELVDPTTLNVEPFPHLETPRFALESWRLQLEIAPDSTPRSLLSIASTNWSHLSVELDHPDGPSGGALFAWALDADAFFLRHHALEDWLERIIALVAAGAWTRVETNRGAYLLLDDEDGQLPLGTPRALPPHPVHGRRTQFERRSLLWPAHWQRASGIDPAAALPRGATHTIAELLDSNPETTITATIAGRVIDRMTSENVTRVRVSDGSGLLDIAYEPSADLFSLAYGDRAEFDVQVPAGPRPRPRPPAAEAAGPADEDPAQKLARHLLARYGGQVGAVATAVRPLDRATH